MNTKTLIRKIEISDIEWVAINSDLEVVSYGFIGNDPNDETAKKLDVKKLLEVLKNADEWDDDVVNDIKAMLEYVIAWSECLGRNNALGLMDLETFLYEE